MTWDAIVPSGRKATGLGDKLKAARSRMKDVVSQELKVEERDDDRGPSGPFKQRFSELSALFDTLEAEIGQIGKDAEGVAWGAQEVMVAEMVRLRMRRVLDKGAKVGIQIEAVRRKEPEPSKDASAGEARSAAKRVERLEQELLTKDQVIADLRESVSNLLAKSGHLTQMHEETVQKEVELKRLQKQVAKLEKEVRIRDEQLAAKSHLGRGGPAGGGATSSGDGGGLMLNLTGDATGPSTFRTVGGTVGLDFVQALMALGAETTAEKVVAFAEAKLRELCRASTGPSTQPMVRLLLYDPQLHSLSFTRRDGGQVIQDAAESPALPTLTKGDVVLVEAQDAEQAKVAGAIPKTRATLFLPVGDEHHPCGVAEVWLERPRRAAEMEDLQSLRGLLQEDHALSLLLTQAGLALNRAVERESVGESATMFRSLYHSLTPLFAAVDDLALLTARLEETCVALLGAAFCKIFVCDPHRDVLTTKVHEQEKQYALRDSENACCHVAVTGLTINLVDCKAQRRFRVDFSDLVEDQPAQNCLCLPIFGEKKKVFGVLVALNKAKGLKRGAHFTAMDEALGSEFCEVVRVALSIAVKTAGTQASIDAVKDQRNNLLANVEQVERGKGLASRVASVLQQLTACQDSLTVVHRFCASSEELNLLDIRYVQLTRENLLLAEVAVPPTVGMLGRCVQSEQPVRIAGPEVSETNGVNLESDLPRLNDSPLPSAEGIGGMLYLPFTTVGREKNQVLGVFRFATRDYHGFDDLQVQLLSEMVRAVQQLLERMARSETLAQQGVKQIYGATSLRGLLQVVSGCVCRKLRCARAHVFIQQAMAGQDLKSEQVWTLAGPDLRDKVELPVSAMTLEGLVLQQGVVVSVGPLNKPSLDHALGNKPSSLLAVPLRHDGKILGVLSAVDKTGMVPFDQLDESRLSGVASATAIALQHALTKLAHKQALARQGALLNHVQGLLPCTQFTDLLARTAASAQQISGCEYCQLLVLNAANDKLVCLKAAEGARDQLDQLEASRSSYAQALKGDVLYPSERVDGWVVTCVLPCQLVSGRVVALLRLHERQQPEAEDPDELREHYRLDSLSKFATAVAETYCWLRRAASRLPRETLEATARTRLILVCRGDGKLARFHGSTKAILGFSDSVLRTMPVVEWMTHNDVFTYVLSQVMSGARTESVLVHNFHWTLKGRVLTAELSVVPFAQDGRLLHCYIAFANIRMLETPMVHFLKTAKPDDVPHDVSAEGFLLGVHVQSLRDDQADEEFALLSVRMKCLEFVAKSGGRIYGLDSTTMNVVYDNAQDFLAAGVQIDEELGPLLDDFGYDLTVVGTHSRLPKACLVAKSAPPYPLARLKEAQGGFAQHLRTEEDRPSDVQVEVPLECQRSLLALLQRALLWHFRGFVVAALPADLAHGFVETPIELMLSPEKIPVKAKRVGGGKFMNDLRLACAYHVHGHASELSARALEMAHRFQVAFSSHQQPSEQLAAIKELVMLLQGQDDLRLQPQLLLNLKRALRIFMDAKVRAKWKGLWTWTEPTVAELERLAEPFCQVALQDEPWQQAFVQDTLRLLRKLEGSDR